MPIKIQRLIAILSVVLFLAKLTAWYLTHSVAIFTDALESTVNVITGFIGLYSVMLAAKPRDLNHPYGHGKVEFISAAIEGSLIFIAGVFIIYEAIGQLIEPTPLHELDYGILITGVAGLINFFAGTYAIQQGKKHKSATLEAAGKHLRVDAYSTFAIIAGLVLLLITGWQWLDSAVALIFALVIIVTGYRVVRKSLAGIMDEADEHLLEQVIDFIQNNRRPQWIDMHNMRVIQYGNVMHVDAHMTLPWYYRVADGEKEIHLLEEMIGKHFGNKIEIFVHIDACAPYSCKLCALPDCPVRQETFRQQTLWSSENVWVDSKHGKAVET
ncbi:MAG TPA: cation diffusion facilitator family transporter [Flavipsychrobacter sp.]|nr:cation diffusion facilitator family transporter [Flavipsychrobacter sp.]